jgi:hypothetical protein
MSIHNLKILVIMKTQQEIEMQDALIQLEMAKTNVLYNEANVELLEVMAREHTSNEFEVALNKRQQMHEEWLKLANKLSYHKNNPL